MTEFELIYRYFQQQEAASVQAESQQFDTTLGLGAYSKALASIAPVKKGLGDDAAVVEFVQALQWVTCVDTLVQGRHFSDDWAQVNELAFAIGFKSVAVNVSDIAAMGASPHSILLALALPERLANKTWLSAFAKGLFHACTLYGVRLIGGDTTRNDRLVISVTANGVVTKTAKPVYRNGAQVGDKVYVSGTLGDASYALRHPNNTIGQQLAHRLHMPTPRIRLGHALSQQGKVTSMIDVSDGLAQDIGHICQQSGVAMHINLDSLPASNALQQVDLEERLRCQLSGGDDYELVFTLPQGVLPPEEIQTIDQTQVTCIGEVIAVEQMETEVDDTGFSVTKTDSTFIKNNLFQYLKLSYDGHLITPENPYPFSTLPTLAGYQHFNQ